MAKLRGPVFAQLNIIAIGIDCYTDAVLGFCIRFGSHKMTAIHQHALTGGPDGVQPAVLGPRDETILNMKNISRKRQHDTAGFAVALKFDVLQRKLRQLFEATEIQQIFKPRKVKILGAIRVKKSFG